MLTSLSFIFLVGLAMGAICQKLKLPRSMSWIFLIQAFSLSQLT